MNFSDLGLGDDLLRRVGEVGYQTPTPIQEQAIPSILQGRDILGCAQTGTGKTASFTLPMIDILSSGRSRARMPRSLILEPTRELATQVAVAFDMFGANSKLTMALLIGGESMGDQVKKLDRGVDVLIATPGRMIDLFERGSVMLNDIKVFVVDEADRMLDMGFIPDIERIVALLPRMRQTLMFSATLPPEIRRLANSFLANPKEITVTPKASAAETVTQALAIVHNSEKRSALRHLLRTEDVKNALIFCNRKRDVNMLYRSLERHGFSVGALHGDMPQSKRTQTLESFKAGELALLVCSDVAARGIDIAGLSHVFNFDVPINAEDYVHRIGRTGRAGKSGRAFTLATAEDGKQVAAITKLIKTEIPRISLNGFAESEDRGQEPAEDQHRGFTERAKDRAKRRKERDTDTRSDRRRTDQPARTRDTDPRDIKQPRGEIDDRPRRRSGREEEDAPVIGFGDHVPAFVLRPARRAEG